MVNHLESTSLWATRRILAPLILLLGLFGCLSDSNLKIPINMVPREVDDGWIVSTPNAEGFDPTKLNQVYERFFSENDYHLAYSLLVIRNGRLVAEGYTRDLADIDRLNNIKSATKSVTSLATGIAISQGFIGSVDDQIYDYIGEHFDGDENKRWITIADALTMRSGLDFTNHEDNEDFFLSPPENSLSFFLERDLVFQPGTRSHYSDLNPHLVSGVIAAATGQSLESFTRSTLLEPLGITKYLWEMHPDGVTYGAFGLYLTPRDFAKFGQLVLDDGQWNGVQLVPSAWIDESTQDYTHLNYGPYGYYWWLRPHFNGFAAVGHGGQFLYLVPSENLLVVVTANPFSDGIGVTFDQTEDLVQMTLDAIVR